MSNGNPIIIKGGESIEILISKDTFPQDYENHERHYCADRRIIRVTLTDENTGKEIEFSLPENGKCTITIEHGR
jgi:hypothetical protein